MNVVFDFFGNRFNSELLAKTCWLFPGQQSSNVEQDAQSALEFGQLSDACGPPHMGQWFLTVLTSVVYHCTRSNLD